MSSRRVYVSDFDNARRLAFVRSRSQAAFRNEAWELTWEEYQEFWSTRRLWAQRGRGIDDLVLTRFNWEGAWSKANCCIISRVDHLTASAKNRTGIEYHNIIEQAKKYESI